MKYVCLFLFFCSCTINRNVYNVYPKEIIHDKQSVELIEPPISIPLHPGFDPGIWLIDTSPGFDPGIWHIDTSNSIVTDTTIVIY